MAAEQKREPECRAMEAEETWKAILPKKKKKKKKKEKGNGSTRKARTSLEKRNMKYQLLSAFGENGQSKHAANKKRRLPNYLIVAGTT
jgi:hypothetical protein